MRLGVTGRSRTGTCGFTFRSSAIELRPHPSARPSCWSRRQVSNLRPDAPEASALPTAPHRDETLAPRRGFEPRTSWLTARRAATCAIGEELDSTVRFELTRACAFWVATRCLRPLGYVEIEMASRARLEKGSGDGFRCRPIVAAGLQSSRCLSARGLLLMASCAGFEPALPR